MFKNIEKSTDISIQDAHQSSTYFYFKCSSCNTIEPRCSELMQLLSRIESSFGYNYMYAARNLTSIVDSGKDHSYR